MDVFVVAELALRGFIVVMSSKLDHYNRMLDNCAMDHEYNPFADLRPMRLYLISLSINRGLSSWWK